MQHTLPYQGKAGPAIALALQHLAAVDVAFDRAVVPLEREPRGDRAQVILQAPREASELIIPLCIASALHASRSSPRRSRTRAKKACLSANARAMLASTWQSWSR
jgi:hypothetical protein